MFALAGCQHVPSEDSQEEDRAPSNQCPDISGTYENIGELKYPNHKKKTEREDMSPSDLYHPQPIDAWIGSPTAWMHWITREYTVPWKCKQCCLRQKVYTLHALSEVLYIPYDDCPQHDPDDPHPDGFPNVIERNYLYNTRIKINVLDDNLITVKLYSDDVGLREFSLGKESGNPFTCKNGRIYLKEFLVSLVKRPIIIHFMAMFSVYLDEDSSLLVEATRESRSLLLLSEKRGTTIHKWKRVE
jgi:hypothetical protein